MRKAVFCVILFLSLASGLFAVDEDTYVQFVADSIIAAHKSKGSPEAVNLWAAQMQEEYPDFMSQDWQSFERAIREDSALRDRIYERILESVRSKGYNARILDFSEGNKTIEIID